MLMLATDRLMPFFFRTSKWKAETNKTLVRITHTSGMFTKRPNVSSSTSCEYCSFGFCPFKDVGSKSAWITRCHTRSKHCWCNWRTCMMMTTIVRVRIWLRPRNWVIHQAADSLHWLESIGFEQGLSDEDINVFIIKQKVVPYWMLLAKIWIMVSSWSLAHTLTAFARNINGTYPELSFLSQGSTS